MEFDEWEPVYERILDDFGFERGADERARDVLAALSSPFEWDCLEHVQNAHVVIAGAGPSLESTDALETARRADVVIAASTAVDVLEANDIVVDCMVTDLDKNPETVVELTERGTPVAVHAHGDNIPSVRTVVPDCRGAFVVPTTQARPVGPVENLGGFTDGDRAAFLADHLGAATLGFVGWDFEDPAVDPMKAAKLEWAERLLYWLERRRGQRFDVLDGRREAIDLLPLQTE